MTAYDGSVAKELHLYIMTKTVSSSATSLSFFEEISNSTYRNSSGTFTGGVVSESMSLTMGFLESSKFELGSYVIPEMQVTLFYHGARYKDKVVRAWITQENDMVGLGDLYQNAPNFGDITVYEKTEDDEYVLVTEQPENWDYVSVFKTYYTPKIYGIITGEVYQENLSNDRQTISLTIRSLIYNAFNTNLKWDIFFSSTANQDENYTVRETMTNVIDKLFSETFKYANYGKTMTNAATAVDRLETILENNYAYFYYNSSAPNYRVITTIAKPFVDDIQYYSLGEIWKFVGEVSGVHWIIDRPKFEKIEDIKLSYLDATTDFDILPFSIDELSLFAPNNTLYPGENRYPLTTTTLNNELKEVPYFISCIYDETIKTHYDSVKYDGAAYSSYPGIYDISLPFEFTQSSPILDYAYLGNAGASVFPQTGALGTHANNIAGSHYARGSGLSRYLHNLDKIIYATLDCRFDLDIRLGDNLSVPLDNGNILIIPVISYQVNGINDLRATYRATAIAES